MNILFCGDANIEKGLYLSVMSLLAHNEETFKIYVMTAELKTEERLYKPLKKETLVRLEEYMKSFNHQNELTLIDITEVFAKEIPEQNINTRFTPLCMLRLFADKVADIPDKILYLDNDVLCRGCIGEFYHQDISEVEYVGVLDHYGSWFFRERMFKRDYVNSGVLLLNMKKIRETGLFTRCRKACRDKKMFMPDQTALNKLVVSKGYAERGYNEQRRLHGNTVLQHFTTSFRLFPVFHSVTVKPWQFEKVHKVLKLNEYDGLFEKYKEIVNDE